MDKTERLVVLVLVFVLFTQVALKKASDDRRQKAIATLFAVMLVSDIFSEKSASNGVSAVPADIPVGGIAP